MISRRNAHKQEQIGKPSVVVDDVGLMYADYSHSLPICHEVGKPSIRATSQTPPLDTMPDPRARTTGTR